MASEENSLLGPLQKYGKEMRLALATLVEKLLQSRAQHEETRAMAEDRFAEIQQLIFEREELRGQLNLSEETLAMSRSKMTRLESQYESAVFALNERESGSITERMLHKQKE